MRELGFASSLSKKKNRTIKNASHKNRSNKKTYFPLRIVRFDEKHKESILKIKPFFLHFNSLPTISHLLSLFKQVIRIHSFMFLFPPRITFQRCCFTRQWKYSCLITSLTHQSRPYNSLKEVDPLQSMFWTGRDSRNLNCPILKSISKVLSTVRMCSEILCWNN